MVLSSHGVEPSEADQTILNSDRLNRIRTILRSTCERNAHRRAGSQDDNANLESPMRPRRLTFMTTPKMPHSKSPAAASESPLPSFTFRTMQNNHTSPESDIGTGNVELHSNPQNLVNGREALNNKDKKAFQVGDKCGSKDLIADSDSQSTAISLMTQQYQQPPVHQKEATRADLDNGHKSKGEMNGFLTPSSADVVTLMTHRNSDCATLARPLFGSSMHQNNDPKVDNLSSVNSTRLSPSHDLNRHSLLATPSFALPSSSVELPASLISPQSASSPLSVSLLSSSALSTSPLPPPSAAFSSTPAAGETLCCGASQTVSCNDFRSRFRTPETDPRPIVVAVSGEDGEVESPPYDTQVNDGRPTCCVNEIHKKYFDMPGSSNGGVSTSCVGLDRESSRNRANADVSLEPVCHRCESESKDLNLKSILKSFLMSTLKIGGAPSLVSRESMAYLLDSNLQLRQKLSISTAELEGSQLTCRALQSVVEQLRNELVALRQRLSPRRRLETSGEGERKTEKLDGSDEEGAEKGSEKMGEYWSEKEEREEKEEEKEEEEEEEGKDKETEEAMGKERMVNVKKNVMRYDQSTVSNATAIRSVATANKDKIRTTVVDESVVHENNAKMTNDDDDLMGGSGKPTNSPLHPLRLPDFRDKYDYHRTEEETTIAESSKSSKSCMANGESYDSVQPSWVYDDAEDYPSESHPRGLTKGHLRQIESAYGSNIDERGIANEASASSNSDAVHSVDLERYDSLGPSPSGNTQGWHTDLSKTAASQIGALSEGNGVTLGGESWEGKGGGGEPWTIKRGKKGMNQHPEIVRELLWELDRGSQREIQLMFQVAALQSLLLRSHEKAQGKMGEEQRQEQQGRKEQKGREAQVVAQIKDHHHSMMRMIGV